MRNSIAIGIATGIACLLVTFVTCSAQAQELETRTLVAPFFLFGGSPETSYSTRVSMTEVSGREVTVTAKRYTAAGVVPFLGTDEIQVEENALEHVRYEPTYSEPFISNGWVRLTYPSNRHLHAVSHLHLTVYSKPRVEFETMIRAVEPARAFRFVARQVGHAETGIAIINPMDQTQDVTVRFYPTSTPYRHLPEVLEQTWTVEPGHRLSKFLTEIVPWSEITPVNEVLATVDQPWRISGVARVIGETEVAVGALDFYRRIGRFVGVPVSAESPEPPK